MRGSQCLLGCEGPGGAIKCESFERFALFSLQFLRFGRDSLAVEQPRINPRNVPTCQNQPGAASKLGTELEESWYFCHECWWLPQYLSEAGVSSLRNSPTPNKVPILELPKQPIAAA
jgi:hypothetical protein